MRETQIEIDRAQVLVFDDIGRRQEDLEMGRGPIGKRNQADSGQHQDDGETGGHGRTFPR